MEALLQMVVLALLSGLGLILCRAAQSGVQCVNGITTTVNSAMAILLEDQTHQQVAEITDVADYRVWAALTIDRLQLPLEYQEELEHAATYCYESGLRDDAVDAGAAYARAVVILVKEYAAAKVKQEVR